MLASSGEENMNSRTCLIAAALLLAGTAQATCYSVYKADGSLLQESSTSPVNLALPIGDTVTEKFGSGASMSMSETGFFCKDRRANAQDAQAVQTAQKSLTQALKAGEEKTAAVTVKEKTAAIAIKKKPVQVDDQGTASQR
jgi:hypothetical protein